MNLSKVNIDDLVEELEGRILVGEKLSDHTRTTIIYNAFKILMKINDEVNSKKVKITPKLDLELVAAVRRIKNSI